jgi:cbb3-type cytochrome c oxidase subunit III
VYPKRHLIAIMGMLMLACSGPSGDEFIGKWKGNNQVRMEIRRDGESFMVVDGKERLPATLEKNGTLTVSSPLGPVTVNYSKSSDTIFVFGDELRRAQDAGQPGPVASESGRQEKARGTTAANQRLAANAEYEKFLAKSVGQLAADQTARESGKRIFLEHCARCHGPDGGGSPGFPDLRDADWLYGGTPEVIKESVMNGRMGVMPPLGAALGGEANVKNVVAYVRSLSGLSHDGTKAQLGKAQFDTVCAACHGVDGKGNKALGVPNLTDKIWLYGSSEAVIAEGINKGRNVSAPPGTTAMPAFKAQLTEAEVHTVVAYVWGLSNSAAASAK